MGNQIQLPNINPDSLVFEDEVEKPVKDGFNLKNYLNVRLDEGQTEKTVIIRLLPMDLKTGSPFVKIHTHNVKVPQEMVKPGEKPYKSYICLSKTGDIDHEKYGSKCPFCEMNYAAYKESTKETDAVKKKELQDISLSYKSKETVIVRCIERGKEDEGVKFWKFNIREKDKQDPYNQIVKLYNMRKEAAKLKNKDENILDIYNGKDLIVTITSNEGNAAPRIVDDSTFSPLSENEELMKEWIFDSKKWQDVFTCKSYEYLELVSQMRIPWYDKSIGKWVDKEEYQKEHGANTDEINNDIKEAEEKLKGSIKETKKEEKKSDFMSSISLDNNKGDDLPF